MRLSERIAREIGPWPITYWVARKLLAVKWRKVQKAPGVQERAKAFSATAPNTLERDKAFCEYFKALQNELAKSKFIRSALRLH